MKKTIRPFSSSLLFFSINSGGIVMEGTNVGILAARRALGEYLYAEAQGLPYGD